MYQRLIMSAHNSDRTRDILLSSQIHVARVQAHIEEREQSQHATEASELGLIRQGSGRGVTVRVINKKRSVQSPV